MLLKKSVTDSERAIFLLLADSFLNQYSPLCAFLESILHGDPPQNLFSTVSTQIRRSSMRTLVSLLATAALVGGVTIASAQSGSPTAPSGPMAGGGSASSVGMGISLHVATCSSAQEYLLPMHENIVLDG